MEWTWTETGTLALQLAMGISLAACAGLRAFLPLLIVGAAGRMDVIPLSGSFEWLESTPALSVFGVAVVMELLGDKFPGVDHFLDIVQTGAKPVVGTILVASVVTELSPLQATVLGILLGGSAAGAVHLVKAQARLLSTATTAGFANPVVSTGEDIGAGLGAVAAIFIPVAALILFVIAIVATVLAMRHLREGSGLTF